jgi:hypothetical protein
MAQSAIRAESGAGSVASIEPLVTVQVIGERLSMKPSAVYMAVLRGSLPVLRVGRRLRFRWSDVVALLDERNRLRRRALKRPAKKETSCAS